MDTKSIGIEVPGFYHVLPLTVLRRTPGVSFDTVPVDRLDQIDAIDRVLHDADAISPGSVNDIARPWYMHPHQIDQLLVVHGKRTIELYSSKHEKVITAVVTPNRILIDDTVVCAGPGILSWPCYVFHRIRSDERLGSASLNFAIRQEGFDIATNFNIYDVDTTTGEYRVIRAGHLDQPGGLGD